MSQICDNHIHFNLDLANKLIFSHLKLWIAVARHNFKRLKIKISWLSALRVNHGNNRAEGHRSVLIDL